MSQIIELKNGETTIKVSTKGAEIISFTGKDGVERIWQADPAVWAKHSPVLFPVICAVKNDNVIVDGVSYPMTKHGFLRDVEFSICNLAQTSIDLVAASNEETAKMFPFDFEFHVCFEVTEDSFSCNFKVVNKSNRMMPFCVGGHPGFICPTEEGSTFEDYEMVFPEVESGERGVLTAQGEIDNIGYYEPLKDNDRFTLDHTFFDENDTIILTGLKSCSVKLVSKKTGMGINFDFGKMPVLAIWSKPNANADYVCIEPWHGLPAGINETAVLEDKAFAIKLEAGESFETGYHVTII